MRSTFLRTAVAGAVGLTVLAVGPASAAPVCELVKDETGDAGLLVGGDDVDIVSADVSSNDKTITAVLRLAGDPTAVNPEAPGGKNYYVGFTAPGSSAPQFLSAEFDPALGASYSTGFEEDVNGVGNKTSDGANEAVKGQVDGNDITITAPLAAFAERVNLRPGSGKKLTGLTAEVFGLVGTGATGGLLLNEDEATGGSYELGAASCAKAL